VADANRKAPRALTAAFVKSTVIPGKYHDGRGTGLFLLVKPSRARSWVQRIVVRGKRRELGLGSPPVVTLAEAREQAFENKRIVRAGRDPLAEKRNVRSIHTFEEAARKTHIEILPTWKNPKDRAAFLSTLERYVFPRFGSTPLSEVTSAEVRQAILAARERVPGVARKLIYRISAVFRWGIAEGLCTSNPSVAEALALPRSDRKPNHRKALPYAEVAHCIEAVKASNAWSSTKLALEFLILSAARSGEVRHARWEEIDRSSAANSEMDEATWVIPAERMKMQRPHRVPLCPRAIETLEDAAALRNDSGLVFPSTRGKALSDMTLSKLVKELGFDADVHGFRTSFRTWAQEQTNFPREVAEAALAHKIGDAVESAYARSDFFEKRRRMMEAWGAFISGGDETLIQFPSSNRT